MLAVVAPDIVKGLSGAFYSSHLVQVLCVLSQLLIGRRYLYLQILFHFL